jgi:hypothetical protein
MLKVPPWIAPNRGFLTEVAALEILTVGKTFQKGHFRKDTSERTLQKGKVSETLLL